MISHHKPLNTQITLTLVLMFLYRWRDYLLFITFLVAAPLFEVQSTRTIYTHRPMRLFNALTLALDR